jgi:hypothetical protein
MVTADQWPRPAINFNTANVNIILFPPGAGGKFLLNSLGVASNACLQNIVLYHGIESGKYNNEHKKSFIKDMLAGQTEKWNDLFMGATTLLGVDELVYLTEDPSTRQYWQWFSKIDQLTNSGLKFFLDTHMPATLDAMLKVWPNAGIIVVDNCQEFLEYRKVNFYRQAQQDYWQSIRGDYWPKDPPSNWQEYQALALGIQRELEEVHHNEIFRHIRHPVAESAMQQTRQQYLDSILARYPQNQQIQINGADWMSWDKTRQVVEQCYDLFELKDLDLEFVEYYYNHWMDAITKVSL